MFTESHYTQNANVMDAIRENDGKKVVLKRVSSSSQEEQIQRLLSSADMRTDPRNRTAPLLGVIDLPEPDNENVLLILPYLRLFDSPPFHCRAEVIEAFRQFISVCRCYCIFDVKL